MHYTSPVVAVAAHNRVVALAIAGDISENRYFRRSPRYRRHASIGRCGAARDVPETTMVSTAVPWLHAQSLFRRHGKIAFLKSLEAGSTIVDVGCGNDSPVIAKRIRPDCTYVGIDVADYNQTQSPSTTADRYLRCAPEDFAATLAGLAGCADAVVSSHNVEHCFDPDAVLAAMVGMLRQSGSLYLAFPCPESVGFPRRRGTLNFYDDASHRRPIDVVAVIEALSAAGMHLVHVHRRYRPPLPFVVGLVLEPLSALSGRCMPAGSTWALYGFETVIWAKRG